MTPASRKWILASGAAALLSSQAVWAAPTSPLNPADPLVSLSLLSGQQSRAAVCGSGGDCAVPASMASAAATSPAVAASAAAAAQAQNPYAERRGLDWAGLVVMFLVPVAIVLSIALEDNGRSPVSPG